MLAKQYALTVVGFMARGACLLLYEHPSIKLFLSALADEMQKPPSGKLIENEYISEKEYFKRQYMFAVEKVDKNHLREIKQRAKATKRSKFTNNQKLYVE